MLLRKKKLAELSENMAFANKIALFGAKLGALNATMTAQFGGCE